MHYEKEIPFGAFDSELMHQEINIPEGFTATIDGNKIILRRTENEDEKIRKWIINEIKIKHHNLDEDNVDFVDKAIAWLEKQGNNINCIYDKELSKLLHIVICRYVNDPDISYIERENVSKKIFPYVELLEKQRL